MVIARHGRLVVVAEARPVRLALLIQRLCQRHDGDVQPVADPRAAKVHVAESRDEAVAIMVPATPVPARSSIVGAKPHHAERNRGARKRVAMCPRPNERVNKPHQTLLRPGGKKTDKKENTGQAKSHLRCSYHMSLMLSFLM